MICQERLVSCRGDATVSMSSDKYGVQAELAKYSPVADYRGCCAHSTNLVIFHACKINSIQNMMDSFHELFSFSDNSPLRLKFLTTVIDALSQETKKRKVKDLYKTRWIEKHSTFETIFDLYKYIVITFNEHICILCIPTNDDVRLNQTTKNGAGLLKLRRWQMNCDTV